MVRHRPAENKTQPHDADVVTYLESVEHPGRREDAFVLLKLLGEITGEPPRLWGPSMIGFGQYHYVYDSGREGDHFLTGFAPRKANMVVYVMPGFAAYRALLDKLGKHRTGSSCLYLGRLDSIDLNVLKRLLTQSVRDMRRKYGA
ncbi:MAG: DUF1801 domain-containing protein [Pseudomonadota bacterium]